MTVQAAAVALTRDSILRVVRDPMTSYLVQAYYDPAKPFAGLTFDTVGWNPPDGWSTDDALAVSLLDTALGPRAVRRLIFEQADEFTTLLRRLPAPVVPLWDATDDDLHAADALWHRLTEVGGVGPTRAGKILARKRPALIPIADSVTVALFAAPSGRLWVTLRAVLQEETTRLAIENLRGSLPASVTTLRLLDTAIWMHGSRSRTVLAEQRRARLVG